MALLNTRSKWRSANRLVLAGTILALAGCVLFEKKSTVRRSYAFSHRAHVEQDLACANCHLGAEASDEPGMPGLGACRICHSDLDKEKPEDRKVDSLFENKKFKAVRQSGLSDAYVFPHLRHVEAGFECARCHEAVATNEDALELPPARMDNCVECHTERNVTNECAACHPTILATTKPASHDELWPRRHGGVCRAGTEPGSDRCSLCHKETDCASCHQTTLPQNHTQQWRRAGHGTTAALDRESCATCHQPSSCVSCHAESKPRTHVGSFGAPLDNHCLTCHEPVQAEGCGACHQGTPSHALAPPKPASHTPSMNCRQCHMPGNAPPGLPHADNGSNCNSCHH
jgi:hypothetical protein